MAGSRHSRADHRAIRKARDAARTIDALMGELGDDDWAEDAPAGEKAMKALSLSDKISAVAGAVSVALGPLVMGWAHEVYDDHAIVCVRAEDAAPERYYRAGYTMDDAGRVTLAPQSEWAEVEEAYVPVARIAPPPPRTAARAVKRAGDYRLRGLGVVYGGRDLYGESFTPETDVGAARGFVGMPVFYDHAMGSVRSQIGQVAAFEFTEDGILFEVEIDRRKAYADTVMRLADADALGMSSGAVAHLVHVEAGQIKRWIIGEISLTPTPAEPRTGATPIRQTPRPEATPEAPGGAQGGAAPDTIVIL